MTFDICPGPQNPRNSEGDTVSLSDGRVLLAWSRFRGREDHARADIHSLISEDGGASWDGGRTLVSAVEADMNVMSVSLLRESTSGDVLLFYLSKNSLADCQVYARRSQDECQSWGEARRVSSEAGYHVMNNARVVELADGRILAPVALTRDYGRSRHQVAFCYVSDDGGRSWRRGEGSTDLSESEVGCQEPGVVDVSRGELMYIRTDLGCVYRAFSEDSGDTWSQPTAVSQLPAPAAPATMARLPDGGLVALYNHREDGAMAGWSDRTPLALARSDDDGQVWRRLADIEESPEYCYGYTSVRIHADAALLTYYVWPRTGQPSFDQTILRITRVPLDRLS